LQAFQHVSPAACQFFAFDFWPIAISRMRDAQRAIPLQIALEETLVGTGM
jgi:hypothetical protein